MTPISSIVTFVLSNPEIRSATFIVSTAHHTAIILGLFLKPSKNNNDATNKHYGHMCEYQKVLKHQKLWIQKITWIEIRGRFTLAHLLSLDTIEEHRKTKAIHFVPIMWWSHRSFLYTTTKKKIMSTLLTWWKEIGFSPQYSGHASLRRINQKLRLDESKIELTNIYRSLRHLVSC